MRESFDSYMLKIVEVVASRATCPRRAVGAIAVNKNKHIMATGYNGVPKGFPHCIDDPCGGQDLPSGTGLDKCLATHAEQNCLLQCNNVQDIYTIYLTVSPCVTCAKLIANTGCKKIVYSEVYNNPEAFNILHKAKIEITHA